jgi:hypothetical protein
VLAAASRVKGPFAVINADDYYGPKGFALLSAFLGGAAEGEYAMVGYRLDRTLSDHGSVSRGICREDGNGLLVDITERTSICRTPSGIVAGGDPPVSLTGEEPASMNFWGFTPDLFGHLERLFDEFLEERGGDPKAEFYLPAAVSTLISEGEASVALLGTDDSWHGLTYPEDRPLVVEALSAIGPV